MRSSSSAATQALLETIADLLGGVLQRWTATVSEPSRDGEVRGFDLILDHQGRSKKHTVFIETDPPPGPREGVVTLADPSSADQVAVWVYPNDPALPALEATVFREAAQRLLARIGITVSDPTVRVLAYRPGRRAVIRVDGPATPVFLKVVRPGRAEPMVARHQAFQQAGVQVPSVLGWSDDGLVALSSLPGVEAQSICAQLPEGFLDQLSELIHRIASVPSQEPARRSLVERVSWYTTHLGHALPGRTHEIDAVGRQIRELLARGRSNLVHPVTIHGDLHIGQIFVDPHAPGRITGVLDIDTAGSGDPADDAAALYAHLDVLGRHLDRSGRTEAGDHARRLAHRWRRWWVRSGDPGYLDRVIAIATTHLLGHAIRQADESSVSDMFERARSLITAHGAGDHASESS